MIKSFMIFFLSIIILLISFVSGWIKINCDGNKIMGDIDLFKENSSEEYRYETPDKDYELMNEYLTSGNYTLVKHALKNGETLYDLEKYYGTNWLIIQKVNKINDVSRLRSGQIIFIPVKVELG